MKTFRRALIGSSLVVAACALASADSLTATATCTVSSGKTELSAASNGEISCTDFDISTGDTLTSISITLNGALITGSSMSLQNTNTSAAETANIGTDIGYNLDPSVSLPGFTFTTTRNGALNANDIFDVFAQDPTLSVAASTTDTQNLTGSGSSNAVIDSSSFANYETNGLGQTFNIAVDTTTGTSGTFGGGNGAVTQVTYAQIGATVVYTYTAPGATPEPTTLFLMGSALVGVGLLRKRMKT